MEALSDVLRAVRLSGAVFFDIHAAEPWVAETPRGRSVVHAMFPGSEHMISYHVLLEGSCWAIVEGEAPVQLSAGDVIVFPHGDTHVLTSTPGLRKKPNLSMYRRPSEGQLPFSISMGPMASALEESAAGASRSGARLPSSGADTSATGASDAVASGAGPGASARSAAPQARFVCGFLGCDARPFNPLLTALPRVMHVSDDANGTLAAYMRFALAESKAPRIGGESVLGRLSELMFLHVVRRYLEGLPAEKTDWLAGLRDQPVGRALAALHRSPAKAWTLQSLAREAGISRSVLAERFMQFVGHPPIEYLTSWRMQLAANQLRSSTESVAEIASRVGYESEAAFSRAFKKAVGTPPSEWRRTPHLAAAAAGAAPKR
jgi:AraC-like DNA-binding protein